MQGRAATHLEHPLGDDPLLARFARPREPFANCIEAILLGVEGARGEEKGERRGAKAGDAGDVGRAHTFWASRARSVADR